MDTVYIAVSPAGGGAVTFLDPDGRMEHHHLAREGGEAFAEAVRRVQRAYPLCRIVAVLEDVRDAVLPFGEEAFAAGEVSGFIRGLMLCRGVPVASVPPKELREVTWKGKDRVRVTGDGIRKGTDVRATSVAAARRIFPGRVPRDGQAPDYDLCVSMLLAEYARMRDL